MLLDQNGLDRNLYKSPVQNDSTKSTVYVGANPQPKKVSDGGLNKPTSQNIGDDNGSPNIFTGTVITACLIQTSALPSRIELAGNDLTFYDNTYEENGVVKGDTSRLVFTHDLDSNQGFIMEKRSSVYDTYDNVLSWYATAARQGRHNYMFIGRNAYSGDEQRHVSSMHFAIDRDTGVPYDVDTVALNGMFEVEYSENQIRQKNWKPLLIGNSQAVLSNAAFTGFSAVLVGGNGGYSGLGYAVGTDQFNLMLYLGDSSNVSIGASMVPDANNVYNIGAVGAKINTIYRTSEVACPLPTVENALEVLEKIPAPTMDVGDRGHFGDNRLYFDDLTFPDEIALKNEDGTNDIEMTRTIGFMLKAIIELNAQVKDLTARLPK